MKIAGIIAEYNPFHKGHMYQIEYTKQQLGADYIIAAMSGDYVQRGTPAFLPKHTRAEMALRCGADLVLELPVSVSTASAEFFAKGGVELLDSLGVIDMLCFGSEAGETDGLMELARLLVSEPVEYKTLLKEYLAEGMTFPAARSRAVLEYFKDPHNFDRNDFNGALLQHLHRIADILASPNNILGIEYCKALLRLNSNIKPVTVKRKGNAYHDTETSADTFASATAIRRLAAESYSDNTLYKEVISLLPAEAGPIMEDSLNQGAFINENDFDSVLHYCLLKSNMETLSEYLDVSPDLAQRMINQRNKFESFSQFASLLKTKEVTQTRIQRALLHILLDIREPQPRISYARVLGFRKDSSALLKEIKKNSSIPLVTKLADAPAVLDSASLNLLEKDTFASNLYESILSHKIKTPFIHEYQKKIIII